MLEVFSFIHVINAQEHPHELEDSGSKIKNTKFGRRLIVMTRKKRKKNQQGFNPGT